MYESLANDKNIEMYFNGLSLDGKDAVNKLECWFDQEKMQKIITNLISNAIKFTPNGGIIEVENFSADNMVTIKVSNSGERIPPEKLPHLFDRFYQADTNSTRAYEGTGIGLALVKELTSLHHGTVKVESSIDRTTFTVSIPQSDEYLKENEKLTSSTPFVDDIIISDSIEPGLCNRILLRLKNASNNRTFNDFGTHHNGYYASVPKSLKSRFFFAFLTLITNPIA